jgi:acyl dehydratase
MKIEVKSPTVDWRASAITDDGIAHLKSYIGKRREMRPWVSDVTYDAIWHFANGLGDDNPMWWDADYGKSTVWGAMIAPPCFLYACSNGGQDPDDTEPFGTDGFLPGTVGVWASTRWRWFRPVPLGAKVRLFWEIHDVIDHPDGQFGGRSVSQIDLTTYADAQGEPYAEVYRTIKRFDRSAAVKRGAYDDLTLATYTAADRERFAAQYESELVNRRGAKPFFFEDASVGEQIGPLLKGPLTITNMIGWLLGWGSGFCQTNRIAYRFLKNHPGSRIFNEETGIEDTIEAPHWDEYSAKLGGFPGGYDFGSQRISWLSHALTDWGGDSAFIEEMEVKLIRPNIVNDTTWISGEVIDLVPDTEFGTAIIALRATNQRNEVTAAATARVRLPRRAANKQGRSLPAIGEKE